VSPSLEIRKEDVVSDIEPSPGPPRKSRNLVVLSDGTGNSSAKLFKTNVWRLYDALDLKGGDQIALYDDGVGTASFAPLAIFGGAFGWGLKRNVLDLYTFLCRNYRASEEDPDDHDRIFAFGFSRGAFTARVVVALVAHEGLVRAEGRSSADIERLAKWAYRRYRASRYRNSLGVRLLRGLRNRLVGLWDRLAGRPAYDPEDNRPVEVEFVGVWDTVAAYGLPIDELTRGWDYWIWPMTPRDQRLSRRVARACHALSLNDERQTFFPTLWDERDEPVNAGSTRLDQERISQVWFAGVHSNVGGGYPDDSLALTPLCWIAGEAARHGLRFMPHLMQNGGGPIPDLWTERATPCAPRHDSRQGLGSYYRYHPRPVARLCDSLDGRVGIARPKVHESVFERIRDGVEGYAPFVLPEHYAVVTRAGDILAGDHAPAPNPFEHSTQAESRGHEQEAAWNLVWHRRVVYFATLAATLLLLLLPVLPFRDAFLAWSWKPLVGLVSLAGGFLPDFASGWLDHYEAAPLQLLLGIAVIALLMWRSARLDGSIVATMRKVWLRHGFAAGPMTPASEPTDWLYRLRSSPRYRATLRFFSFVFWPHLFGIAMLILLVVVLPLRGVLAIATAGGMVCPPLSEDSSPLSPGESREVNFEPWSLCQMTNIQMEAGARYHVKVELPPGCRGTPRCESEPIESWRGRGCWADASSCVDSPAGFPSTRSPLFLLFTPARRVLSANWFVTVASIGRHLPERHPLSAADGDNEIRAVRSGPLALFVNDAVLPWPCRAESDQPRRWRWDCFYMNNRDGDKDPKTRPARVTVTRLP
jgi:uncharacterized protein (DUF2235 family)